MEVSRRSEERVSEEKEARPGWVSEAPVSRGHGDEKNKALEAAALVTGSNGSTTQPLQALFPLQPQGWAREGRNPVRIQRISSQVRSVWGLRAQVLFL